MKNIGLLCLVLVAAALCAGQVLAKAHVDARVGYLKSQAGKETTGFTGSIRFIDRPTEDQFVELEALGVAFRDFGQGREGSRTVYPVSIPFSALADIADLPNVMSVDCSWSPGLRPCLSYATQENQASAVWQLDAPGGGTVTGEGVTVLVLDAGTDVLHPHYFKQDGQNYSWFDCDESGGLTIGDGVDVNSNGRMDRGENLWYHESALFAPDLYNNDPSCYNAAFDFLYNDANGNLESDYGPPKYKEDDPCFGEQIFLTNDANQNDKLDPGETLFGLGESKIKAIHDYNGQIYRRGENLLKYTPGFLAGHGFLVGSILGGGWSNANAITGVAPGVEYVFYNISGGRVDRPADENYGLSMEAGLAWGVGAEGATVVNISAGDYFWRYLDGSSNLETMIDEYSADGVLVACAAGNESASTYHSYFLSGGGQTLAPYENSNLNYDFWISFLWRDDVELDLTLTSPEDKSIALPADGSIVHLGRYKLYSNRSVSCRGTHRYDIKITWPDLDENALCGEWDFEFSGPSTWVHGWAGDMNFTPGVWTNGVSPYSTTIWPSTGDAALAVAGYHQYGDNEMEPGQIGDWCGKGPRIDGAPAVDIAVPSHWTAVPSPSDLRGYGFTWGATSYSSPQLAGAAALFKDLFPDMTGAEFRAAIHAGALWDGFCESGGADVWGAGKLRIYSALAPFLAEKAARPVPQQSALRLTTGPNPFNPETKIRCYLEADQPARVRVFAVDGTEIWDREIAAGEAGWREITWRGVDRQGRGAASGVYYFHVKQGTKYAVAKATLLK